MRVIVCGVHDKYLRRTHLSPEYMAKWGETKGAYSPYHPWLVQLDYLSRGNSSLKPATECLRCDPRQDTDPSACGFECDPVAMERRKPEDGRTIREYRQGGLL
jgi:hypothetical protein